MEIKELVSYYINETSHMLEVTFRILTDNDDEIRTDQIVLEEIDIIINKIYNNIPDHKYISIQIQNKTGWNIWFDKLDKGFYPHVYIIMTTNKSINYFDELDKSYMRNNRVNLKAELQSDKTFVIL